MENEFPETTEVLRCAFGDNLQEEDYLPLLYVLYHDAEMGFRSLAMAMANYFNGNYEIIVKRFQIPSPQYLNRDDAYAIILNDTYLVDSGFTPKSAQIEHIKKRLEACGYTKWLEED